MESREKIYFFKMGKTAVFCANEKRPVKKGKMAKEIEVRITGEVGKRDKI